MFHYDFKLYAKDAPLGVMDLDAEDGFLVREVYTILPNLLA